MLTRKREQLEREDSDDCEAIEIAPDFPNSWYNLRDLMLAKGDKQGAEKAKNMATAGRRNWRDA